ncbi:MAG: LysR family transcriptional regulator [Xylophilus ampelinus]
MTLKQLEAFCWAARCASFALAAERLHLSVSSLSRRIAELEQALGATLFDRTGHRAALTAAGERLLPRARTLLEQAEATRRAVAGDASADAALRGVCRLGVGELTALTWLPRLVAVAAQRHPGVRLELRVDVGAVLEQQLHDGRLDCAVIAGRSARAAIASQPVGEAVFRWVAAPAVADAAAVPPDDARRAPARKAPGASRGAAPPGRAGPAAGAPAGRPAAELLRALPLVALPAGAGTTRMLEDWCAASGVPVPRTLACNSLGAVAGLLIEGLGVGYLPAGWAGALARRGDLRLLAGDPPLPPLGYSFQWRRDDARPLVGALGRIARECADFSATGRLL